MRLALLALALLCPPLLSACAPSCQDACDNTAKICGKQFEDAQVKFDVQSCTDACEANADGCKNLDDEVSCVASATACADLRACPECQK